MMTARESLPRSTLFWIRISTVTWSPLRCMPVTVPTGMPATVTGFFGSSAAAWMKSAV